MASPSPAEDREVAYRRLIDLGIALSAEHNHDRLLETILLGAKELTNADGGTLYLVGDAGRRLHFTIMHAISGGLLHRHAAGVSRCPISRTSSQNAAKSAIRNRFLQSSFLARNRGRRLPRT